MKNIPITQGKTVLVDDTDFEWLSQWKWQFGGRRYAVRTVNHSQKIYMHREITKAPQDMEVDHINGDELDNRRENLRIVSIRQNQLNARPHKNSKSGYKGVYHRVKDNKWVVYIEREFLGSFIDKIEAARVYNQEAAKKYGEYARLNDV